PITARPIEMGPVEHEAEPGVAGDGALRNELRCAGRRRIPIQPALIVQPAEPVEVLIIHSKRWARDLRHEHRGGPAGLRDAADSTWMHAKTVEITRRVRIVDRVVVDDEPGAGQGVRNRGRRKLGGYACRD